jgi:hypothetical protein
VLCAKPRPTLMRRCSGIATALFSLALSACGGPRSPESARPLLGKSDARFHASAPFCSRVDATVTLHPRGFTFRVPSDWVRWHSLNQNNMHLSREQLATVEKPEQDEWDSEFARACNAALPFNRCAAHIGSEGWGPEARFYSDLQLRIYDLADAPEDLEERIVRAASLVVRPERVLREDDGAWRRILIAYTRLHFDYEATAYLDFRLKRVLHQRLIFVFMYTDALERPEAIPEILSSLAGNEAVKPGKGEVAGPRTGRS